MILADEQTGCMLISNSPHDTTGKHH